jgi:hypothetical protein
MTKQRKIVEAPLELKNYVVTIDGKVLDWVRAYTRKSAKSQARRRFGHRAEVSINGDR